MVGEEKHTAKTMVNLHQIRSGAPKSLLDINIGRMVRQKVDVVVGVPVDTSVCPRSGLFI